VVETVGAPAVALELPSQKIDMENLAHLSPEQKTQLLQILDKYPDVFSDEPGHINVIEHEIWIMDGFKPKIHRAYKIPEILKEEVKNQIQEMLALGIVRPSTSEMVCPLVCVLKGH
jgi:hypothetical protein